MESTGNLPINCDVKTFNEIWCGAINDACDSHYEPEIKPDKKDVVKTIDEEALLKEIDEDDRFFGTHIREAIRIFKYCFKK